MKPNHHELTLQLWNLLTKEEMEKGRVWVKFDHQAKSKITTGSGMVDEIKRKSCYRDHIVGFKRMDDEIHLVLDEEGQKLWNRNYQYMVKECCRYND